MSKNFNKWCEERAEEIMEEEYGPNWRNTCDDGEYESALYEAGNDYPMENEDEDNEDEDIDYYKIWKEDDDLDYHKLFELSLDL